MQTWRIIEGLLAVTLFNVFIYTKVKSDNNENYYYRKEVRQKLLKNHPREGILPVLLPSTLLENYSSWKAEKKNLLKAVSSPLL